MYFASLVLHWNYKANIAPSEGSLSEPKSFPEMDAHTHLNIHKELQKNKQNITMLLNSVTVNGQPCRTKFSSSPQFCISLPAQSQRSQV